VSPGLARRHRRLQPRPESLGAHPAALGALPDLRRGPAPLRASEFLGVALNTYDLSDADAKAAIRAAERDTGLPVTDPVRYDPTPLVEAIAAGHERWKAVR
jgi:uncharacterized NAD-dependent epimerase/dehydratase family protein